MSSECALWSHVIRKVTEFQTESSNEDIVRISFKDIVPVAYALYFYHIRYICLLLCVSL